MHLRFYFAFEFSFAFAKSLVYTTNVHTHKGQSHSPNVHNKVDATTVFEKIPCKILLLFLFIL